MVAFLKKPEGSAGFHQIVDFLNSTHIKYALTENPTIYVSLIHQFWQTASASTSENGEMEITATIDGRVKTVTEASIRRHLKLEDSDGISTLPNTKIFEQLALMGSSIKQETEVPQPSSPPHTNVADEAASTRVDVRHEGAATTVTSLDAGQGSGNIDKTPSMPHDSPLLRGHTLGSDEGIMQHTELMDLVTKLSDRVVALEIDLKQTKKVYGALLYKNYQTGKVVGEIRLQLRGQEKTLTWFSQIKKIDEDEGITLVQMGVSTASIDFATANVPVTTTGAEISTASPEVKTADDFVDDIAAKSAAKNQDKVAARTESLVRIAAIRLQDSINEESDNGIASVQELASSFNIEEWENIQARVEADEEITVRLQLEEQGELTIEERSIMFVELMDKRKKYFAAKRAEEKRNKPLTQY
ncbi:hypothetical protein Tco_1368233 [Tanacetum coccineum]